MQKPLFCLATSVAAVAGCSDFATPAELSRPQVLALRADPPTLSPTGASQLDALVAGPDGVIEATARWSVVRGPARIADGNGQAVLVPAASADADDIIEVAVELDVGDGEPLLAIRTVALANEASVNPTIGALRAGGAVLTEGEPIRVADGEAIGLDVEMSPPGDEASVAWYSTRGEIGLYRRTPSELVGQDPGTGTLVVVCRDGRGGVAWDVRELEVTP